MKVFQQAMKTHHGPFYHNLLFKENMNSEYWHGSQHFLDYLEQIHSLKVSLNPTEELFSAIKARSHTQMAVPPRQGQSA